MGSGIARTIFRGLTAALALGLSMLGAVTAAAMRAR